MRTRWGPPYLVDHATSLRYFIARHTVALDTRIIFATCRCDLPSAINLRAYSARSPVSFRDALGACRGPWQRRGRLGYARQSGNVQIPLAHPSCGRLTGPQLCWCRWPRSERRNARPEYRSRPPARSGGLANALDGLAAPAHHLITPLQEGQQLAQGGAFDDSTTHPFVFEDSLAPSTSEGVALELNLLMCSRNPRVAVPHIEPPSGNEGGPSPPRVGVRYTLEGGRIRRSWRWSHMPAIGQHRPIPASGTLDGTR